MMPSATPATAIGFGDRPEQLRLVTWKLYRKGKLRGFSTVTLLSVGLKLIDCPVYISDKGAWAALPQKPEYDRDDRRRVDINGQPVWSIVLEWRNRELADRLSAALVAAVRRAHPRDLED
jgi:hypothetical protein